MRQDFADLAGAGHPSTPGKAAESQASLGAAVQPEGFGSFSLDVHVQAAGRKTLTRTLRVYAREIGLALMV